LHFDKKVLTESGSVSHTRTEKKRQQNTKNTKPNHQRSGKIIFGNIKTFKKQLRKKSTKQNQLRTMINEVIADIKNG
jgi:hypothetical protein